MHGLIYFCNLFSRECRGGTGAVRKITLHEKICKILRSLFSPRPQHPKGLVKEVFVLLTISSVSWKVWSSAGHFQQNEFWPRQGPARAGQISRQSLIISFQFIQFKVQSSNRDGNRPSHEQNQIWFLLLKFWLGSWKFYEMKALLILCFWYSCLNCDWIYHGYRQ